MKTHLNDSEIKKINSAKASIEEKLRLIEHLDNCSYCKERYIDSFNNDTLLEIPVGFEVSVKKKTPESRVRVNFISYTLQVGIAVAASLVLIFNSALLDMENYTPNINPPDLSFLNSFTEGVNDLSNKFINMEVLKND